MRTNLTVQLLVENRAEELIANGIFADLIRQERLRVKMCWESSSAVSIAEAFLLEDAEMPVALALNCNFPAPEEFRAPFERILLRDAPRDRWIVALAIPNMTTWLKAESSFNAAWAQTQPQLPDTRLDLAVFFKELAARSGFQFNREEVASKDQEFARLLGFIGRFAGKAVQAA